MEQDTLKLVIVGSIDHGKSTLIGRLFHDTDSLPEGKLEELQRASEAEGKELEFGFIMDHLREERSRGITIDTAQAFFSTARRDYIIIDAPGHKEFLKNMITGASQADTAVLICSAWEGIEEQTRRHAYLLKPLGLDQIIVLYNKMDLVEYDRTRFEAVREELRKFLDRMEVTAAMEIPISAKLGENIAERSSTMEWYRGPCVLEALDTIQRKATPLTKPVRFAVQDVYRVDGRPLAAGRVESGVLEAGATLRFLPSGENRAVRAIRKYGEDRLPRAEYGECIGIECDDPVPERGQIGVEEGHPAQVQSRIEASLFWLSPEPLTRGDELTLRCSTQESRCTVTAINQRIDSSTLEHLEKDASKLRETEVGRVLLDSTAPLVMAPFTEVPELGRFVLVNDGDVVAGGILTDR